MKYWIFYDESMKGEANLTFDTITDIRVIGFM